MSAVGLRSTNKLRPSTFRSVRRETVVWRLGVVGILLAGVGASAERAPIVVSALGVIASWEVLGRLATAYHHRYSSKARRYRRRRRLLFAAGLVGCSAWLLAYAVALVNLSPPNQRLGGLTARLTVLGLFLAFRTVRQSWRVKFAAIAWLTILLAALGGSWLALRSSHEPTTPAAIVVGNMVRLTFVFAVYEAIVQWSRGRGHDRRRVRNKWEWLEAPVFVLLLSVLFLPPSYHAMLDRAGRWTWFTALLCSLAIGVLVGRRRASISLDGAHLARFLGEQSDHGRLPFKLTLAILLGPPMTLSPWADTQSWLAAFAASSLAGLLLLWAHRPWFIRRFRSTPEVEPSVVFELPALPESARN